MSDQLLLTGATLADGSVVDVRCASGLVAAVGPRLEREADDEIVSCEGFLLTGAFCEPHAHLDKAFLAEVVENPTGDLMGAINAMAAARHLISRADIVERAERAVRVMVSNGVTFIRSHADTTPADGLDSVLALVEVRRRVADLCDLQIVALSNWPISGLAGRENLALLRDAIDAGADLVGGCPHLDPAPEQATDTYLEVAAELGVGLDLHTDETLDPRALHVRTLATRVLATGFAHHVAASHCCSLGMQPAALQQQTSELIATADVTVIALPQTNLFLQARDSLEAMPRGLTAVKALSAAGVRIAAGADNLQDPFNPVGRGDPLETASLMVTSGHLLPRHAYELVAEGARRALGAPIATVSVGSPADLVGIRSRTPREAVAFQPPGRIVVRCGRILRAES